MVASNQLSKQVIELSFNILGIAEVAAALGNAGVALINSTKQLQLEASRARINEELERSKSEAARILEVVKTNDPDKAATNLKFLIDTGLIADADVKKHIQAYLEKREPGDGRRADDQHPRRSAIDAETAALDDREGRRA